MPQSAGAKPSEPKKLGIYVNPNFLWFTLFVGLNLLQSGVTNSCPMMAILRRAGLPSCVVSPNAPGGGSLT